MIRSWWDQRLPRERRLLAFAGAVLVAALAYSVVWQPYQAYRSHLAEQRAAYESAADRLARLEAEIRARQAALPEDGAARRGSDGNGGSLLGRVDRSLADSGLRRSLGGLAETGERQVAVRFTAAGFTDMLVWLADLTDGAAVAVQSAELSPAEAPGKVTGRVVLRAGERAR